MADIGGLFSVPAMFIVFRETVEAAIIVSVLLGVLNKTGLQKLNKWVWIGVGLGLLFTFVVLAITLVAFALATARLHDQEEGINGTVDHEVEEHGTQTEIRLKAGLTFSASIMIAYVCWTLDSILKKQKKIENEILNEAEEAVSESQAVTWKTLFFLSFTAVAREGLETVIFLGVGSGFNAKSIYIPIVVGFFLGSLAGLGLYRLGTKVALVWFFRLSTIFLAFVGAGVFSHGWEEMTHLRDLGWWGHIVYNISLCCGLRYPQWALFRSILGYTPYPSRAELIGYFAYHAMIIFGFLVKWYLERKHIEPGTIVKRQLRKLKNKLLGREDKEVNSDETVEEKEKEVVSLIETIKEKQEDEEKPKSKASL